MMALDPVTALLDIGSKVIDKLWPDPVQRDAAKLELFKLQQSGELAKLAAETELARGQQAINAEEAKNSSIFISGWRPAIGWTCALACAWNWIGLKVALFVAAYFGHQLNMDPADISEMLPILLGMLGLGGLRTAEKINGVAAK
jgi:hypothetical protein